MGNNSCGARSIVYGKMMDHVQELRMLLIDGTELRLRRDGRSAPRPPRGSREGEIFDTVAAIVEHNDDEIARRFPNLLRRVSRYSLGALRRDPRNLISLLVGSAGTLGVITEATVGLVPQPGHAVLAVVHFADLFAALEAVPQILPLRPSAIELIDRMVLEMTAAQLEYARRMTFVQGAPDAVLVVEFSGDDRSDLLDRLTELERRAQAEGAAYATVRAVTPPDQDNIWRVRKAGQGLLQGVKGDAKPIAFVEDTAVPPDRLAPYMRRFKALLDSHGVRAAFYAHASVGCLHVRPLINLKERRDIEKMKAIASAVGDLVVEFGGTMSGEHGGGLGACRKTSEGTMCPSYMVTREEEHSTRGRANLLRAVLSGVLPPQDLVGRRLFEALDLCLECKGCKAECPANVDMAKLKYEFLAQYYKTNGLPLRAGLFGRYRAVSRLGSATAPLSTWAAGCGPVRWALDRFAGIDRRRRLPPFARQNFLTWWKNRE